jgi:hypothetical protein
VLHILPVSDELNVGVIKQQPLLQLFTESIGLVMVTKVADDALQYVASIALGRDASEEVAEVNSVLECIYCGGDGFLSHLHDTIASEGSKPTHSADEQS